MNHLFLQQHASDITDTILSLLRCYTIPASIQCRLKTVLRSNQTFNRSLVARELGVSTGFVIKWRARAEVFFSTWPGAATDQKGKLRLLYEAFSDHPRSGAPLVYAEEQLCAVMALALKCPTECGREITHWTQKELADEANKQQVASGISKSTVGRLLRQADIKPHRTKYWLNPKVDDEDAFRKEVNTVCETYHQAPQLAKQGVITVSVDEKTGIQALQRIAPDKPMEPGRCEKREFEYTRHGTLCLTPSFNVVTGQIMQYRIAETRDEQDFFQHIEQTVALSPDSSWVFVMDQLNVHKSESLVRWVARHCGIDDDLGIKGKSGVLRDMVSRQHFLSDQSHRIRFVYTPKHCSWLNQVEIWFGILSRKLLRRGDFSSLDDLRAKLTRFIDYFNNHLAKPFRWTYKGKVLVA